MNEHIKWRVSVLAEKVGRDRKNPDIIKIEHVRLVREYDEAPSKAEILSFRGAIIAKGHTIIRPPEIKTIKHTGRLRKSL